MAGPSASTSVIKRESNDIGDVTDKLEENGWERTSKHLGERVQYYENSGMNITVVDGVAGTIIMPSGPLRGLVFGDSAVTIADSSLGLGQRKKASSSEATNTSRDSHT